MEPISVRRNHEQPAEPETFEFGLLFTAEELLRGQSLLAEGEEVDYDFRVGSQIMQFEGIVSGKAHVLIILDREPQECDEDGESHPGEATVTPGNWRIDYRGAQLQKTYVKI